MALKSLFHELQEKNVAKRCHCNAGHLCILVICCVYRIRVLMETWKKRDSPSRSVYLQYYTKHSAQL